MTDTLITASTSVLEHALQKVYSREGYEDHIKRELAAQIAQFIIQERPDLINVSKADWRGVINYEIQAHLLSPAELKQLVEKKAMRPQEEES